MMTVHVLDSVAESMLNTISTFDNDFSNIVRGKAYDFDRSCGGSNTLSNGSLGQVFSNFLVSEPLYTIKNYRGDNSFCLCTLQLLIFSVLESKTNISKFFINSLKRIT